MSGTPAEDSAATPVMLVVSGDLMVASRLAALAAAAGVRLVTRPRPDAAPAGESFAVVIVDLQAGDPATTLSLARQRVGGKGRVVAFGPHVAAGLLAAARSAGADETVSRGELLGGFGQLARKWLAHDDPAA